MEDPQITHPMRSGDMIIGWVLLLFALTVLGAMPLLVQGINFNGISPSTRYLPLIMTGMLVTSSSPTLSALAFAGFYPGAGGTRSLARQVMRWRVPLVVSLGGGRGGAHDGATNAASTNNLPTARSTVKRVKTAENRTLSRGPSYAPVS